jgi:hypothetical protein
MAGDGGDAGVIGGGRLSSRAKRSNLDDRGHRARDRFAAPMIYIHPTISAFGVSESNEAKTRHLLRRLSFLQKRSAVLVLATR